MYKREGKPDICLFTDPCDFRCGINTLSAKVSTSGKDPFSNTVFIFCNRRKDCLKMLYWGGTGFWLLQFRLEEGKFRWLKDRGMMDITYRQMEWLLDGMDMVPSHYNNEVKYKYVI